MTSAVVRRRPLPNADYLVSILTYEDGALFWKTRPVGMFKNARLAAIWNSRWAGTRAGSPMKNGYRMVSVNDTKLLEHRLIHHMVNGPVNFSDEVDHIDHDHTNNHAANLRLCTHAQNLMNQPGRTRCRALPKHVHWSAREGKFKVALRANGRRLSIGTFETLEEAASAANAARKTHHGIFSNSNEAS